MTETLVHETLEATMRDGTVLRSDVWRPSGGGKHPLLLIRLPYDKSQGEDLCYAHPSWYARHGYAVVSQDVRGRWASGGEFTPFESEADDGEDATVEVLRPDAGVAIDFRACSRLSSGEEVNTPK